MLLGILSLLAAFFLGLFVKRGAGRLILASFYLVATFSFANELRHLASPVYYHFAPQTFALFNFAFVADFLSLTFATVVCAVGVTTMAYSAYAIDDSDGVRFSTLINFFTLVMLGLVLSSNLLGMYVFWELTTLASFLLIAFNGSDSRARAAAWQSLLVTALGGLCLLCGLLLLGDIGQSYDLTQIRVPADHPWMGAALILIVLGALTKAAQFPFYFWLPNATVAPVPATAYLHSAALVQAGIFLLYRLSPFLASHIWWAQILRPIGLTTAMVGALLLFVERDLKRILAFTTVASMGLVVFMLGKNNPTAYFVGLLWLVTHSLYKAPIFLLAGNIERFSGTRDITALPQLYPRLKGTLLIAFFAMFSLLGLTPALPFYVKDLFFQFFGDTTAEFLGLIIVFASIASVGFTLLYPFVRNSRAPSEATRLFKSADDRARFWLPPLIGLLIPIALGVWFEPIAAFARVNLAQSMGYSFSDFSIPRIDWHLQEFATSTIIFLAVVFAVFAYQLRRMKLRFPSSNAAWNFGVTTSIRVANFIFRRLQNNRIEHYLLAAFAALLFLLSQISGLELALPLLSSKFPMVTPFEFALVTAMIIAAGSAMRATTNVGSIAMLGVVGFGTAYLYLANAAPDLALTQFLVESITLLLLLATFRRLPKQVYHSPRGPQRVLFMGVSIAIGLFIGTLTFLASSSLRPQTLERYYGEKSVPDGHGRSVVNVTLTDFRGFDTLGEITVLAIAAVGVASLARRRKLAGARS